jgi:CRP-like cAMP-binding protein
MHSAILDKVPILEPLPARAVFALAREWTRNIFLPDDEVVREDEFIKAIYFVVRGTVGTSTNLGMGVRPLRLLDLAPGCFFGEECRALPVDGSPYHRSRYTATSVGYCELLSIPGKAYIKVSEEHEEIGIFVNPLLRE